jgi:hypothetical protein
MTNPTTHSEECWRWHHECAIARIEQAKQQEHILDCPRCGHCCPSTAEQAQPVAWRNAALRVGEDLSSVGPDGYYDMNAEQWLDWAMAQEPRGKTSLTASPTRQPLTDAEIYAAWEKMAVQDNGHHARLDNQPFVHFARAIEAAHGIKEGV